MVLTNKGDHHRSKETALYFAEPPDFIQEYVCIRHLQIKRQNNSNQYYRLWKTTIVLMKRIEHINGLDPQDVRNNKVKWEADVLKSLKHF